MGNVDSSDSIREFGTGPLLPLLLQIGIVRSSSSLVR
jgi:hypothetical protein